MEHSEILPMQNNTHIDVISSSPDGTYIAVGFSDRHIEMMTKIEGLWTYMICTDHEPFDHDAKTLAIMWHCNQPRRFLVAYSNGIIEHMTFDEYAHVNEFVVERTIDMNLDFFNGRLKDMDCIALNGSASEFSAVINNKIFTFSAPFATTEFKSTAYYDAIPQRFTVNNNKPFGLWYLTDTILFVTYPLGMFTVSTVPSRNEVLSTINIPSSRRISNATLSPDKSLCIVITRSGQVEMYSMQTQTCIGRVAPLHGPFAAVESALFYDERSVILSYAYQPRLAVLPHVTRNNEINNDQVILYDQHEMPAPPYRLLGVHSENGRRRIFIYDSTHRNYPDYHFSVLDPWVIDGTIVVGENENNPIAAALGNNEGAAHLDWIVDY